jgi:AmiR/NasT family two-component response regulator
MTEEPAVNRLEEATDSSYARRQGSGVMVEFEYAHLRVLIANEKLEHLDLLAEVVVGLGHEVIAQEISVMDVAAATARELPDVAFVGLGISAQHALDLIGEIVHEAACPVIALLAVKDTDYVREAAKRGIFASVFHEDPDELRSAIEIALCRFADYHKLQDAFARRAAIEQAKGILMSRNGVSADQAFASLRDFSGRSGTKLVDVAGAIIQSHGLLLPSSSANPPI